MSVSGLGASHPQRSRDEESTKRHDKRAARKEHDPDLFKEVARVHHNEVGRNPKQCHQSDHGQDTPGDKDAHPRPAPWRSIIRHRRGLRSRRHGRLYGATPRLVACPASSAPLAHTPVEGVNPVPPKRTVAAAQPQRPLVSIHVHFALGWGMGGRTPAVTLLRNARRPFEERSVPLPG